jgi:hypothetical protein
MGLFPKEAHQGKKEKSGTLGPWAGLARVRVLGGVLAPPYLAAAALLLPFAAALGCLGGGVRCTPPPPPTAYIKGGPREEGLHKFHEPLLP